MLGSATLVAIIVTLVVEDTLGAANMPLGEIVPFEDDQDTAVFEVLLTVAENCCVPAEARCAEVGESDIAMGMTGEAAGVTVTEVAADFLGSAMLVALTMTAVAAVTLGAVNIPLVEMVPAEEDHATAVLAVLLTVAVNCWAPPEGTVGPRGDTLMLTELELLFLFAMFNEIVASPRSALGRSVTRTRKLKDPALRGVPRTAPLLLKTNPCGKSPLTRENWYRPLPPEARK